MHEQDLRLNQDHVEANGQNEAGAAYEYGRTAFQETLGAASGISCMTMSLSQQ